MVELSQHFNIAFQNPVYSFLSICGTRNKVLENIHIAIPPLETFLGLTAYFIEIVDAPRSTFVDGELQMVKIDINRIDILPNSYQIRDLTPSIVIEHKLIIIFYLLPDVILDCIVFMWPIHGLFININAFPAIVNQIIDTIRSNDFVA